MSYNYGRLPPCLIIIGLDPLSWSLAVSVALPGGPFRSRSRSQLPLGLGLRSWLPLCSRLPRCSPLRSRLPLCSFHTATGPVALSLLAVVRVSLSFDLPWCREASSPNSGHHAESILHATKEKNIQTQIDPLAITPNYKSYPCFGVWWCVGLSSCDNFPSKKREAQSLNVYTITCRYTLFIVSIISYLCFIITLDITFNNHYNA